MNESQKYLAIGDFFPANYAKAELAKSQIATLFIDLAKELNRRFKEVAPDQPNRANQAYFHGLTQKALYSLAQRARTGQLSDGHDVADFQRKVRVRKIEQKLKLQKTDPLEDIAQLLGLKNWNSLLVVHQLEAMEDAAVKLTMDIHLDGKQPSLHDALITYQNAGFAQDAKRAFMTLLAQDDASSNYAASILRAGGPVKALQKENSDPEIAARDRAFAFFGEFAKGDIAAVPKKSFKELHDKTDEFYQSLGHFIYNNSQQSRSIKALLAERSDDLPRSVNSVIPAVEQNQEKLKFIQEIPIQAAGEKDLSEVLGSYRPPIVANPSLTMH